MERARSDVYRSRFFVKVAEVLFVLVLAGYLAGCMTRKEVPVSVDPSEADVYSFSLHVGDYPSNSDMSDRATEIVNKIMQEHGYKRYWVTETPGRTGIFYRVKFYRDEGK